MARRSSKAFMGTGWSFPPVFSSGGRALITVAGPENIHKSIWIILNTRLGERVMQERFGCGINNLQFEPLRSRLINDIKYKVEKAILLHEPRVKLDEVEVVENPREQGVLQVHLRYTIKSVNSRFNLVYPFYLKGVSATR